MPRENETPRTLNIRIIPFSLGLSVCSERSDRIALKETGKSLTPFSEANSSMSFTESCLFLDSRNSSKRRLKSFSRLKTSVTLDFSISESYIITPSFKTSSACLNIVSASNATKMLVPVILERIFLSEILTAK